MIPLLVLFVILASKLFSDFWSRPLLFQKLIIFFMVLTTLLIYIADATKIIHEQPVLYRNYTDRKNHCGEEVLEIIDHQPDSAYYTNNCEYFYFMTGLKCRSLVHDKSAYAAGGDIYQAVKDGAFVSLSDGFGTDFPAAEAFIEQLDYLDSGCYLNFYRWPHGE